METAYLKTNTLEAVLKQLRLNFGGSITKESNEYMLEINNDYGIGKIKGIPILDGVSYIEFDMNFSDDVVINIDAPNENPLYFAYCSKGRLGHSFGIKGEKRLLESFKTGILTSQLNDENIFYFNKNEHLKLTLIIVHTINQVNNSENNELISKLQNAFFNKGAVENFVYISSHNLKIAEKVHELNNIKQEGLVRSLLIQGIVQVILALEIQQHSDDVKNSEHQLGSLTKREIEIIKQASLFVKQKLGTQLSIDQLCSEFGIYPSKLQEGFKLMHDRTVTDYIREIRFQHAEELIKNTDMNISEVVYSIGFSSRSYFSKIFKEKYDCSPSYYKKAQKTHKLSA